MSSHPELIDALRKAGEQKATAVWEAARAEAEQCKAETTAETGTLRERAMREMAADARQLEDAAIAEADSEARSIRMATTTALAERVYGLAREALPRFRDGEYEGLFAALAEEIPAGAWQRARVNPADRDLAKRHFPDAEIMPDEAVVGGMEVAAQNGRIRISNTLEKRLARAWPDVLPSLINDILEESSDHRPPA